MSFAPSGLSPARPPLRVLLSLAPPDGTTKYVVQLVEGVPEEVTLLFFSWKTALLESYDVFHVHWPEFLIRGQGGLGRVYRCLLFAALLLRLKLSGIALVRTVHNLAPHEAGPWMERTLLELCDRQTVLFIRLNSATDLSGHRNVVTILHGHYKDRFKGYFLPPSRAGRFLYFGLIRPYKGVDDLIAAFSRLEGRDLDLRIVGKPSGGLGEMVTAACLADVRVSAHLEFVEDEVLVHEIGEAEIVVLPYREMQNSGSLLVALSLVRPVIAPDSPSNRLIADEVGTQWLYLYEGPLTAEVLLEARSRFRLLPAGGSPDLRGRDWKRLGEAHYQADLHARAGFAGPSGSPSGVADADPRP